MNSTKISEQLRKLATDNEKRTKSARLNDIFEDIEFALNNGIPRQIIVDLLNENGLEISLKSFESTLARLRKKRKAINKESPLIVNSTPSNNKETKILTTHSKPPPLPKTKEEQEEFAKKFVNKSDTFLLDVINKGKK